MIIQIRVIQELLLYRHYFLVPPLFLNGIPLQSHRYDITEVHISWQHFQGQFDMDTLIGIHEVGKDIIRLLHLLLLLSFYADRLLGVEPLDALWQLGGFVGRFFGLGLWFNVLIEIIIGRTISLKVFQSRLNFLILLFNFTDCKMHLNSLSGHSLRPFHRRHTRQLINIIHSTFIIHRHLFHYSRPRYMNKVIHHFLLKKWLMRLLLLKILFGWLRHCRLFSNVLIFDFNLGLFF